MEAESAVYGFEVAARALACGWDVPIACERALFWPTVSKAGEAQGLRPSPYHMYPATSTMLNGETTISDGLNHPPALRYLSTLGCTRQACG